MRVARAEESSQLESKVAVWMGTLSVWPSTRRSYGVRAREAAICRSVASVFRPRCGGAGIEEAGFAQADDQAVAAHLNGDRVLRHLVGETLG